MQLNFSGRKPSVPQVAKQILVSDQDRHVIAFGCDGLVLHRTTQGKVFKIHCLLDSHHKKILLIGFRLLQTQQVI